MSSGDILSISINLAVGIYFAVIYPRSVRKRFSGPTPPPRAFTLLYKVVPVVGYVIIAMTVIYTVALLTGMVQPQFAG
ncbi:MAG: hypothetical protein R6X15_05585 [Pseudomonadota bacterium]